MIEQLVDRPRRHSFRARAPALGQPIRIQFDLLKRNGPRGMRKTGSFSIVSRALSSMSGARAAVRLSHRGGPRRRAAARGDAAVAASLRSAGGALLQRWRDRARQGGAAGVAPGPLARRRRAANEPCGSTARARRAEKRSEAFRAHDDSRARRFRPVASNKPYVACILAAGSSRRIETARAVSSGSGQVERLRSSLRKGAATAA